ncbi:MAG: 1-(5-phosphoribosyl)-5-[(5-phosphoribosylamino)methylideneamino] imidazole-4-carboxamide isomerase [Gemmatimonadetes bacterium]|nr:1-(5-phosphoribosyl)-5-[(5-phosphoribosylamino)methylideneamino] imidazole-4-carboxamide isomerase [Gemmatimonadota bacterium]
MIAVPAVDLKGGRCVQLVGGRPEEERVSLPAPASVARRWWNLGFRSLHIVDLDAALGTGDNRERIADVLDASDADVQVGGGIRDDDRADTLVDAGVDRIVVGTRAIDDRAWLESLAARHPARVVVAADIRDGVVLRKGWTEDSALEIGAFLESLGGLSLAGVLCTDVGREGRLQGIDAGAMQRVIRLSPHPVWVSGGVTTMDDLAFLEDAGAYGVVLGMALYTGALRPTDVADRWGSAPPPAATPTPGDR